MELAYALARLSCPHCHAELRPAGDGVACTGATPHTFGSEDGFICFAPPARPGASKYDPTYASRYAALWAYGCDTLHLGWDEPLYATVAALVARALGRLVRRAPLIVDCGCGVGRVSGDCAELTPHADVLGFDLALPMLDLARRITLGGADVEAGSGQVGEGEFLTNEREAGGGDVGEGALVAGTGAVGGVTLDLGAFGFGAVTIPPRRLRNVFFACADVTRLPVATARADVALSVNVIDRVPEPAAIFRECRRVLRDRGTLVFTNPLNWPTEELWKRYPTRDAVLALIEQAGFRIDRWFDELPYKEIVDKRGSFEQFSTLVVIATAVG